MADPITAADVQAFLGELGYSIPVALLEPILCMVNKIIPCLDGGGNRTLQAETSMENGIAEVKAYLLDDQANNGEITRGYAAAMGQRVVARGSY